MPVSGCNAGQFFLRYLPFRVSGNQISFFIKNAGTDRTVTLDKSVTIEAAKTYKVAIRLNDVLMQHRWAPMLVVARLNVGPSMLAYVNATIGCLVEAGFSYALADEAWNILDGYVHGFVLRALNFPLKAEEYAAAARGFAHMLPPERYPYMRALTDLVADGEHSGQHDFELGLDLVLDGLEALLARERAGARRRRAPKKKRT